MKFATGKAKLGQKQTRGGEYEYATRNPIGPPGGPIGGPKVTLVGPLVAFSYSAPRAGLRPNLAFLVANFIIGLF